jgi:hypothetical protein
MNGGDQRIGQKAYVFTEVIFDGTDKPFAEALADFRSVNPTAAVMAVKPWDRRALVWFGQEGLSDDDVIDIPKEWHSRIKPQYTWRELRSYVEAH